MKIYTLITLFHFKLIEVVNRHKITKMMALSKYTSVLCVCMRMLQLLPVAAVSQSNQQFFSVVTRINILNRMVSNCSLCDTCSSRKTDEI